jgi:hypothetical protein
LKEKVHHYQTQLLHLQVSHSSLRSYPLYFNFYCFACSFNRTNDCCYCRLNTDNIIIVDKIVVDIKQNKSLFIASFLEIFFNALSSFVYGMLSFCARFCGCHLVKQQPSLISLLLLAAATT